MPGEPLQESTEDFPAACWVAFGYQNHVIPLDDPRRTGTAFLGLCGVMTEADEMTAPDDRPTCSVCAQAVRCGAYRIVGRNERKTLGSTGESEN